MSLHFKFWSKSLESMWSNFLWYTKFINPINLSLASLRCLTESMSKKLLRNINVERNKKKYCYTESFVQAPPHFSMMTYYKETYNNTHNSGKISSLDGSELNT